jgi:hypothetical protein
VGSGLLFFNLWEVGEERGVVKLPNTKKEKKTFGGGLGARLLFFKFVNQTLEK